jgi:hypothetical protein
MGIEQKSGFCRQCNQSRLFTRQGVNHILHLLLFLFLCGLWLPIWIVIAIDHGSKPYFCATCGLGSRKRANSSAWMVGTLLIIGMFLFVIYTLFRR